jgi:hypothetical protein
MRRSFAPTGRTGLATVALLAVALLPGRAPAQQQQGPGLPRPRLLILNPPGARAGSEVEVTLTGQDVESPQSLLFDHPGFKAELLPEPPPDPKKPAPQRGQGQGQNQVSVRFKVAVPAGAPLGNHDVRLVNKYGVSNPRAFVVGDLPEVLEKEPNNDVDQAQRVELNSAVEGTVSTPTDVDYYVFAGKKGQHVVVSCLASSIDSKLPAGVELYGSAGNLLAVNRDYNDGDSVLDCTLPEDGDYQVRVFAFTYTLGGPDCFYRLTVSTAPWIDAVFPPVVEPGKTNRLTVYGRNLPGGRPDPSALLDGRPLEKLVVRVDVPNDPPALQRLAFRGLVPPKSAGLDGFEYRLHNDAGASNPFLLTYARAPVVLDSGANDTPETAQEVTLPCEIAGRIEKRRDRDWYTFSAKKGDVYSIEAFGDRLGAPEDLYLTLRSADGKQTLAELDDNPEVLNQAQFLNRTDDPPRYRLAVPADGRYQLLVGSRAADLEAGPRQFYTVRITPEQPDFRLVLMPAMPNLPEACVVPRGGHGEFTVYVWRQEGFTGDVTLTADGLPEGVTCPPQVVGRGDPRNARLVLAAAPDAPAWAGAIRIKGTAEVRGRKVEREARAASVTWPSGQNQPPVARLDQELVLAVGDQAPYALTAGLDKAVVNQGEKVEVPVKLQRFSADFKAGVQVVALNLPDQPGANRAPVPLLTLNPGTDQGKVVLDVKPNALPGTYSVVLYGMAQSPFAKGGQGNQRRNAFVTEPSTPVQVTVLPKQVAAVQLSSNNVTVKPGKEAEVVVRVNRMFEFDGEFKVELVLPSGTKGLRADEATIPAGENEAKLVIRADSDAGSGNRGPFSVRATAVVHEKTTVAQEAKLSVNVVK